MKRMFLLATMATLMTLPATNALARQRGGGGHGGRGCMGQALKAANLTPDQQKRLQEMRRQHQDEVAPLRDQLKAKGAELRGLWKADAPNRAAILAKQDEMDVLRRQLRTANIDHRLAMLGVLTPDQRTAFRAQAESCGLDDEDRGPGPGHGPGSGPGPRAGGR